MSSNVYLPISPVAPPFLLISNITQAVNAVITVTTANSYVVGQVIHLTVPWDYGMYQANQLNCTIISVDNTNLIITTDLNTQNFDAFTSPSSTAIPASLSPAGSRNLYNISYVPFHSVDGSIGN